VVAGQRVSSGAHGVERIGLGPGPSLRPHWPVQLDHHLLVLGQVLGQAGAVAAAAFHRPGPQPRVLFGEGRQLGVAVGVRPHCPVSQHGSGGRRDDRGGVRVLVGVDADDDLDQFCQHGHAFFS
jgi:hypothetical protein